VKWRLLGIPAASLVLAAALAAGTHEVKLEGMKFAPASLTVQRGDTVTWRNADVVPHTATAAGKFDSGNIAPGKSVSKKMDLPGEFDYVCSYHPGMKARLVVK
jgi:plastocyanin